MEGVEKKMLRKRQRYLSRLWDKITDEFSYSSFNGLERLQGVAIKVRQRNYIMSKVPQKIALGLFILTFCNVAYAEVDMTKAVIHHTATNDVSVKVIRRYHTEHNKWKDVGYHFIIRQDGSIETGRSLYYNYGAHAKGRNNYIGIVLTGYEAFSDAQVKSLKVLLRGLQIQYIENHHQYCPGKGLDLKGIANELGIEYREVK